MSPLVLSAVFAAGLTPSGMWDAAVWRRAPVVELSGVGGAAAAPARVCAVWNGDRLFVEFVCRDEVLVSPGGADGLDHCLLGDVAEVFVAGAGAKAYAEFHATPRGRKSVYYFKDYRKASPPPAAAERVTVRTGAVPGGWRAVFALPWEALGGDGSDEDWEIFLARYDYEEPGGAKVLSSWPAQQGRPDFHRRSDYARLKLQR